MAALFEPILGTESEFGTSHPDEATTTADILKYVAWEFRRRANALGASNDRHEVWGRNGSRLYKDVHDSFEYATPECRTPIEAVVHELAGPHFINRAFTAQSVVQRDGFWIIKNNNPPGPGNSYSNHVNIQMLLGGKTYDSRFYAFCDDAAALVVALTLIAGAGLVLPGQLGTHLCGPGYRYRISARSDYIGRVAGSGSTRHDDGKPIFLHRDEPLADSDAFWRLQVIGLDSNILPLANLAKLTVLQLAAEMWCAGVFEPIILNGPVHALHQLSADWRSKLSTGSLSRSTTAVEILQHFYNQAAKYVQANERDIYLPGLRELRFQIQAFAASPGTPPPSLIGHNDWVTKYYHLKRSATDFKTAERIHLAYHSYQLGKNFDGAWPHRLISKYGWPGLPSTIKSAIEVPPLTRAHARGRFIEALSGIERIGNYELTWNHFQYGFRVTLDNPRPTTSPVFEKLLAEMNSRPRAKV